MIASKSLNTDSKYYSAAGLIDGLQVTWSENLQSVVEAAGGSVIVVDSQNDIRESEIVGLFGLVGSGRTDVARAIFGVDRISDGSVSLNGQRLKLRAPEDAIRAGIALAPEDRKLQGLILGMPVRANISLPTLRQVAALIFLRFGLEQKLAKDYKVSLDIRAPSVETVAKSLSGGNQQKVVIAKWLAAKPRILILDEPTRGIDVAGKSEVHRLIIDLARQGVGILLISSEMPEVMGISDRILVMHEGRLVGEQSHDEVTEEKLMMMATGQCAGVATPRNGVPV
ncbi:MAG: sugar ABC transporter ATP-binding protein [Anaerolineae bacterium]|nr:sugar ABC transporter ATP-binding protein [Anaerolineae bacterium]